MPERELIGPHVCGACGTVVQAEVHGSYVQKSGSSPIWTWVRVRFGECLNCHAPMVFSQVSLRPDAAFWGDTYTCHYPADGRALPFDLPEKVQKSYEQAIKSERGEAHDAVAVMVRRTLEAVAGDIVPTEGGRRPTLFQSLQTMKDRGAISDEMHTWATKLRIIGNTGAHAGEEDVTEEDAKDALDFLQAMLEVIYHFRPRFKALEARRAGLAAEDE